MLEQLELDAELAGSLLDEAVDRGIDDVREHGALRQHRRFEDHALLRGGIDIVEIELHDDELGACDEIVDDDGQRMIARPQDVHRAEQA